MCFSCGLLTLQRLLVKPFDRDPLPVFDDLELRPLRQCKWSKPVRCESSAQHDSCQSKCFHRGRSEIFCAYQLSVLHDTRPEEIYTDVSALD